MPDSNRYARKTYSPDGVNREFVIDIPYQKVTELHFQLDGVDQPHGTHWTLTSPATARFVSTPPAGNGTLVLTRETAIDQPAANFTSPGTFTYSNLNRITKQLLYGVQESHDRSLAAEAILAQAQAAADVAASSANDAAESAAIASAGSILQVADLTGLKALLIRPEIVIVKRGRAKGVWQWEADSSSAPDDALAVQCTLGDAGRYKRVFSGMKNLLWWDAKGDGIANDTAALQAALDTGGAIYAPPGIYNYTDFDISVYGTGLFGAGPGKTFLRAISANAEHIQMYGGWGAIRYVTFDAAVDQTGGYFVGTGLVGPNVIENCEFTGCYRGVLVGVGLTQVNNCYFHDMVAHAAAPGSCGIEVLFGSGLMFHNIVMSNPLVSQSQAGIKVTRCDDCQITHCQFFGCGADLLIAPNATAAVGSVQASNTFFDTANFGLIIAPTEGQQVLRCLFDACWFGNHYQDGIVLSGDQGIVSGVQFTGCLIAYNGRAGVAGSGIVTYGTSPGCVKDVTITGCQIAGNKDAGISLSTGCREFTIVGNHIGFLDGLPKNANDFGIYDNGADNYLIASNNLRNNEAAPFIGYTRTDTRIARDNLGFLTEKDGYVDGPTTDASGDFTVSHGLGITPQNIQTSIKGVGANYICQAHSVTLTTFKIRVLNFVGSTVPSTTIGYRFNWRAAA